MIQSYRSEYPYALARRMQSLNPHRAIGLSFDSNLLVDYYNEFYPDLFVREVESYD